MLISNKIHYFRNFLLQNTKFNIMIKIFLCSSLADAAQLLSKFVVQLQRKIVAFIPTASINEEHT